MIKRGTGGRPVVLIVEDEPLIAMELKSALSEAGYDVLGAAATEREALDFGARGGFDCAVLDIQLREGTSAALARRLTAARVPFVVMTGLRPQDVQEQLLRNAPLLKKPFRLGELLDHLEGLLQDSFALEHRATA